MVDEYSHTFSAPSSGVGTCCVWMCDVLADKSDGEESRRNVAPDDDIGDREGSVRMDTRRLDFRVDERTGMGAVVAACRDSRCGCERDTDGVAGEQ